VLVFTGAYCIVVGYMTVVVTSLMPDSFKFDILTSPKICKSNTVGVMIDVKISNFC